MIYLQWTPNLSVGDATLDGHHKKLIDLINIVFNAMTASDADVVDTVLDDLIGYTRYHFAEEEKVMKAVGFPDLDEHCRIHGELTRQVVDMRQRHKADPAAVPASETFDFLSQWLVRHILANDLRFRPYVEAVR